MGVMGLVVVGALGSVVIVVVGVFTGQGGSQ